ncbi:hypothetical protein [Dialister invisus]
MVLAERKVFVVFSKREAVDEITQPAFYTEWSKAWAAFGMVKEVYAVEK